MFSTRKRKLSEISENVDTTIVDDNNSDSNVSNTNVPVTTSKLSSKKDTESLINGLISSIVNAYNDMK